MSDCEIKIGDVLSTKHTPSVIGICVGILQRETGYQYHISFMDSDLQPKVEWFYHCEIDSNAQHTNIGFKKE